MKPKDRKDTQRAALELIILAAAALTMLIIVLKFLAVVIF